MTSTATRVHALTVETTQVDDVRELIPLTDSRDPLLWLRDGDGLAGFGEAARLVFEGEHRLADAAEAWRALASEAGVDDALGLPGTGLVAFGAFTFSASSARPSVLIVPEVIVGRRGGVCWVTRVRAQDEASPETPRARPLGRLGSARFTQGALAEAGYRSAVREAIGALGSAALRKVVLARDLVGRVSGDADIRVALDRLAHSYAGCWTYAVDGLLGASPERLVRVHAGEVASRVLAGTAARGSDAARDAAARDALAASAKDHEEHAYAVGSVLDALGPHCDVLGASEQPFTLELPNLWHLATDVHGTLSDGSSALDLVAALHPTAAVAGTPTDVAVRLIERLEPFDRGRYAGPVGWVGANGDGEWAIALRGAEVSRPLNLEHTARSGEEGVREVRAFAGCGIVAHSDPDAELAESTVKLRPILDAFA